MYLTRHTTPNDSRWAADGNFLPRGLTLSSLLSLPAVAMNAALEAMKRAEPELMQAAQRNIIHRNNASRKVSRLTHAIAKLAK